FASKACEMWMSRAESECEGAMTGVKRNCKSDRTAHRSSHRQRDRPASLGGYRATLGGISYSDGKTATPGSSLRLVDGRLSMRSNGRFRAKAVGSMLPAE